MYFLLKNNTIKTTGNYNYDFLLLECRYLSIEPSICLSISPPVYLSICLSIFQSVVNIIKAKCSLLSLKKLPSLNYCFGKQCHYSRFSGKTYEFLVPLRTCQVYVQKTLGQNNALQRSYI